MISAIILAGGKGKRMGAPVSKQFIEIKGKPIIYYTIKKFSENKKIDNIVVVLSKDEVGYFKENILEKYNLKVDNIVIGGTERQDSVYNGLKSLEDTNTDIVLIHDGARPFVNQDIIRRCMQEVQKYQACVVGMPVKDTIKIADEEGYAKQTPDRKNVWMIQTPQTFSYALIYEAYEEMLKTEDTAITDDAMVLERIKGKKSKLIEGSYRNIKITTPEDLLIANVYLQHPE